jgi:hypothetical protein
MMQNPADIAQGESTCGRRRIKAADQARGKTIKTPPANF